MSVHTNSPELKDKSVYGVVAEFDKPEDLVAAGRTHPSPPRIQEAGCADPVSHSRNRRGDRRSPLDSRLHRVRLRPVRAC